VIRKLLIPLSPALLWFPTDYVLRWVLEIEGWAVILLSSTASVLSVRICQLAFKTRLSLPLIVASSVALLLTSFILTAVLIGISNDEIIGVPLLLALFICGLSGSWGLLKALLKKFS
jgi:hypothetical protein